MVADAQAGLHYRVVDGDQGAGGLDLNERTDRLRGPQTGHAEVSLAQDHVVLGPEH